MTLRAALAKNKADFRAKLNALETSLEIKKKHANDESKLK